jgi:hypothetical protein
MAHLMAHLARHADSSRGWILDWGWLKVVVEIYRSAPFEELRHFTGNGLIGGLQTLILNSDTIRQLREPGQGETVFASMGTGPLLETSDISASSRFLFRRHVTGKP